jgi:transposase InsO family protein
MFAKVKFWCVILASVCITVEPMTNAFAIPLKVARECNALTTKAYPPLVPGNPAAGRADQGSQFTSFAFTNTLKDADIRISMDGRGRWMDNVFIERLWRSLKYECVFLNAFESGSEARTGIGRDAAAKEMTDTQIEEAQKLARDWKPTTKPPSLLLQ